jgi:hypothetical protein
VSAAPQACASLSFATARPAKARLALYTALAALTLVLAFSRFSLGPWYHTYRPVEVSLLQGWPAPLVAVF